jgi:hypothetical protein
MKTDAEGADHDADGYAFIGACFEVYNQSERRVGYPVNVGAFAKLDWRRRVR